MDLRICLRIKLSFSFINSYLMSQPRKMQVCKLQVNLCSGDVQSGSWPLLTLSAATISLRMRHLSERCCLRSAASSRLGRNTNTELERPPCVYSECIYSRARHGHFIRWPCIRSWLQRSVAGSDNPPTATFCLLHLIFYEEAQLLYRLPLSPYLEHESI